MAIFLIFKGPHWMDALSQQEIDQRETKNPGFRDMYDRRFREYDFVYPYPDTAPITETEKKEFYVLRADLSVAAGVAYVKPLQRDKTDAECEQQAEREFPEVNLWAAMHNVQDFSHNKFITARKQQIKESIEVKKTLKRSRLRIDATKLTSGELSDFNANKLSVSQTKLNTIILQKVE